MMNVMLVKHAAIDYDDELLLTLIKLYLRYKIPSIINAEQQGA